MNLSAKLSEIKPNNLSTWKDKIFLTIDIDWAHDQVLSDMIDLLDLGNINVTWFVTHDTPLLDRLRENKNYELGIHPNFNWLLSGDFRNGSNVNEVIEPLKHIVPEAQCVRSHSLTTSKRLTNLFSEFGLTHEANNFIPASCGLELRPWYNSGGMINVPYCWEDSEFCNFRVKNLEEPDITATVHQSALKVFDFHPIHVFLNTELINRYERTRNLHLNPDALIKHRYSGYGARSQLLKLIDLIHGHTEPFVQE
jgi:hypothetical protein